RRHARRDRDRDRQDVVDQQRRRRRQARQLTEVLSGDDIGAAPAGIGADRLAVGGGDDDEQGDDPDGDRQRVPERDRADDRHGRHQHEKDLLGGGGDRGGGIG